MNKLLNQALHNLAQNQEWLMENENYAEIIWLNSDFSAPSKSAIEQEMSRLQTELDNKEAVRQSALDKLAALGLTPEEIAALS